MVTINHIFIDFENIQPPAHEFAAANSPSIRLWILHGAHQREFPSDLVRAWQPIGDRMLFAQSSKTGPNAVDMLLAFCMGEAYQVDKVAKQAARHTVVSRDKDFDALTLYMKHIGIPFHRVPSLSKALALVQEDENPATHVAKKPTRNAGPAASSEPDGISRIVDDLRKNARNRPKRRSTLEHKIQSILGGKAAPAKVEATIAELERRGVVRFNATQVLYQFA